MENESHSSGGAVRDDVPVTERIAGDVHEQVHAQSSRAADGAQHAADAARQAAEKLRGQEAQEAWMAGLVEQGADRLADLARTLRDGDPRTMLAQVEDFARRQPVLFTGAAMALGFALTRAAGMTATTVARPAATTQEGFRHDYR